MKAATSSSSVIETEHGAQFKAFKEKVKSNIITFFDNVDQLQHSILHSLKELEKNSDLKGWVRGEDVISATSLTPLLTQLGQYQAKNTDLQQQIAELKKTTSFGPREATSLTPNAKHVLLSAKHGDAVIRYFFTMRGTSIKAGNEELMQDQTPREAARWKSAIGELIRHGLAELTQEGAGGPSYLLTFLGHQAAEHIEKHNEKQKPA